MKPQSISSLFWLAILASTHVSARGERPPQDAPARSVGPVSYQQAAALSPAERATLNRKAKRGDWQAAFALALYYQAVDPKTRNQEYFLTLASKSGSREGIEALADFYSTPGGIFQPQVAISLRKNLKRKFPAEVDNIDWAESCAFKYHYLATADARKREAIFLKLAASWGSTKAKETLRSIEAQNTSANETATVVNPASKSLSTVATRWSTGIIGTRLEEPDRPVVEVWSITQTTGELVASCRFANVASKNYRPITQTIEGEWRDGYFWPTVAAEVGNAYLGEWIAIPSAEQEEKKPTRIRVLPGEVIWEWRVRLDKFLPYVDKYVVGRLVVSSGDSGVFELRNLRPPE